MDLDWISGLYELGQKAANGGDPQQVRQEILEHIVRGFDAASGSIALIVDGTHDQLELAAGTDLPPGIIGNLLPRGTGVYGHVVATGQPVLVNGNAAETGLPFRLGEERRRLTPSAMCWPLRVAGRTIGAVAVNRAFGSPRYTPDDLEQGQVVTSLLALVLANHRMHVERDYRILELSTLNATMRRINAMLEDAQNQVIQSEKLAAIGQLAAGVAHEINNPLAFSLSNLGSLESYLVQVSALLRAYIDADRTFDDASLPVPFAEARALRARIDVDFLLADIGSLVGESRDGLLRVKQIVQDLRDFSRGDVHEVWQLHDVRTALDSALNIGKNELKHKTVVVREYGTVPEIECMPSRLNQVFLNLLVNAGHSIAGEGTITISTRVDGSDVCIDIADSGCGISAENLNRVFDPFFTTKPVGQGTGLGLSVSRSIVRHHGGQLDVQSEVGRGTCFTVRLPLQRTSAHEQRVADAVSPEQRAA